MQILTIAGNVGKDAVLRHTHDGEAVLGFSVAVDNGKDRNGNKREPTWVDCSLWGDRASKLATYITKGSKLALSGQPTVRAHEGKAYLGLRVGSLTFMGGSGDRSDASEPRQQAQSAPDYADLNDDIPF